MNFSLLLPFSFSHLFCVIVEHLNIPPPLSFCCFDYSNRDLMPAGLICISFAYRCILVQVKPVFLSQFDPINVITSTLILSSLRTVGIDRAYAN